MSHSILIVDDDDLMRRSLALGLGQAGYQIKSAAKAEDAIEMVHQDPPDLVLLDIGLPGMDGFEAICYLKDGLSIPVIFLTAHRRNLDEIVGLEIGADDYITKPYDLDVLLSRIKAVLRRARASHIRGNITTSVEVGDLVINPGARTVTIKGRKIDLRRREFDLLHALALQPNRVLSLDDLLTRVWGAEYAGESQVVYVHIRWLRQKIEEDPGDPQRVITVHGIGYKLIPQDP